MTQRSPKPAKVRRHKPRVSNVAAGLIAIGVIGFACYAVFGGSLPFGGTPFVLKAAFTSATELHIPSPVRIAGVNVGEVTSVSDVAKGSNAAVVTMHINNNGLPIHADATVLIRSRIFLEGNFYVALSPGTPGAPILPSGATLGAAQTSGPVQLDRILASLRSDARGNLQTLLQGLGSALNAPPVPAQDRSQDLSVRGLTGAEALNRSLNYSATAFRASAIVNQALLGEQPNDLSKVVVGNSEVFHGLAASGAALSGFVNTFNRTMADFASHQQDLSETISLLPALLRNTDTADAALDASFPPTKAFAAALLPGVNETAATIRVGLPWLAQATALNSPNELGGLLNALTPAVQNTASSLDDTRKLLSSADNLARCFIHNLIPTGNSVISDPPVGTGLKVYQELFQGAVGIAGAGGNFDGNGRYVRSSAGGGTVQVQTSSIPGYGPMYGNAVLQPLGTRPAFAGSPPPLRRDVPCYQNAAPALNSAATGAGP
jgi:phospholipid/cholesterol/gamma-HCH transport system substrate-binding protein